MFRKRGNHDQKRARIQEKLALIVKLRGLTQEQRLRYLNAQMADQDSQIFKVLLKAVNDKHNHPTD